MQRFRGGLVFKAHRLLYHSTTLGLRVIKTSREGNERVSRRRYTTSTRVVKPMAPTRVGTDLGCSHSTEDVSGLFPSNLHPPHDELLLHRNVQRFRSGLVFKAYRLLYHSTLGLRVIKKKRRARPQQRACGIHYIFRLHYSQA